MSMLAMTMTILVHSWVVFIVPMSHMQDTRTLDIIIRGTWTFACMEIGK
jgi:hypothetical protein